MKRVLIRKRADQDFKDAKAWYDEQQVGLGDEFGRFIASELRRIQQLPLAHPIVIRNVHRLVLQAYPFSIFYRVMPAYISVIAIYHHRRDPRHWQSRV